MFSRSVPQQIEQISPLIPGQWRRALRVSQISHFILGFGPEPRYLYRIIGVMARTDLYLKIELDLADDEQPGKLASEICRQVSKIYGVRSAEVQNIVTPSE